MRPSHYHYLKRIWTRNNFFPKFNLGCSGIFLFPFVIMMYFFQFGLLLSLTLAMLVLFLPIMIIGKIFIYILDKLGRKIDAYQPYVDNSHISYTHDINSDGCSKLSITIILILFLFLTILFYEFLGLFPIAFIVILFSIYYWVKRQGINNIGQSDDLPQNTDTDTCQYDSRLKINVSPKCDNAPNEPTSKTNDSEEQKKILIYAAMCEKHAREKDYMEKLGILKEEDN